MRISDWSSDVCSSDLPTPRAIGIVPGPEQINQFAGNAMLPAQRVNKGGEAIRETRLAQIAEDCAAQDDGAFIKSRGDTKVVEPTVGRGSCRGRGVEYG